MTQYILPAQAFAAENSPVASAASGGDQNLRNLHHRIATAIGARKGTTRHGTIQLFDSNPYLTLDDALYAQLVADGVIFSDAQYNSATAPGSMASSSIVPALFQHGKFKQVVDIIGTSIINSGVGANSHPELNLLANKLWTQAVVGIGRPYLTLLGAGTTPDVAYTCGWAHSNSRIVRNFGRDSGRAANISGFTYTAGTPWLPNLQQIDKQVIQAGQQHVYLVDIGTNDIAHGDANGGLAAVPLGTAGASSTGAVNFIDNALIPLINALKALDSNAKIIYSTPIARGNNNAFNPKFVDISNYVVANRVALGIDVVIDTRNIPEVTCATPSVTTNATYYQSDNVHLRAAANIIIGNAHRLALDNLLIP
jgi:lysophospholipase L1-like esterase